MKRCLIVIFSLLVICLPAIALGDSDQKDRELDAFLQKVERSAASVESFSCNFIQTRYLAIFPRPVKFSGRLMLSRPDRLRWEFSKPLRSVLVLNGRQGMKCDGTAPVREFSLDNDPVMRMVASQLWAWASGSYRQLREDFDFELQPGPTLVFSPQRLGAEEFIQSIRVLFDKELLQPLEVEMNGPGGDRTLISFSDYQRNIILESELFTACQTVR